MQFKKSSAYTIGKSQKIEKQNDTPGIGLYNPKEKPTMNKAPNYAFMKTKKMNDKLSKNPGPGEYELDVKLSKTPQYSFPKKKKEIIINNNVNYAVSSPSNSGNYDHKSSFEKKKTNNPGENPIEKVDRNANSSAKFDKKPREVDNIPAAIPGPGAYSTPTDKLSKNQIFSFGKEKRMKEIQQTPGPGEYLVDNGIPIKNKNIASNLGKTNRDFRIAHPEITPGPGNYSVQPKNNRGPKYTIGKKKDNVILTTPGPGEYIQEYKDLKTKAPIVKIGLSSRDDLIVDKSKTQTPGPGMYNSIKKNSERSFRFGKDKKLKPAKEETPGPGHYLIPCSMIDVPGYQTVGGSFDRNSFKYV